MKALLPPSITIDDLDEELKSLSDEETEYVNSIADEFIYTAMHSGGNSKILSAWSSVFSDSLNSKSQDEAAYDNIHKKYITDMCYVAAIKQMKLERRDRYFQGEDAA